LHEKIPVFRDENFALIKKQTEKEIEKLKNWLIFNS